MNENADPNSTDGRVALERAALLHDAGRFEAATQEIQRYLAANPDDSDAYMLLALCYIQLEDGATIAAKGEQSKAIQSALEGIRLSPDSAFAHYCHAIALGTLRQFTEAEQAAQEAIRLDPQSPLYYSCLAQIFIHMDRPTDALRYADYGLALDLEHIECGTIRATSLMVMGRRKEGQAAAENVLRIDPENAAARTVLGGIALQAGDNHKASDHFRSALRLDPSLRWAAEGYARANKRFYLVVSAVLDWIGKFPAVVLIALIAGWIGAHALPRLAITHPRSRVWVIAAMVCYLVANLGFRLAPRILDFLARRLNPWHSDSVDPTLKPSFFEAAYFLSLGCLPISLMPWPHGLLLSLFADFLLVVSIMRAVYKTDPEVAYGLVLLTCVSMLFIFWLRVG